MKLLLLGDNQHPNTQNWIHAFKQYGNCEVISWCLPWPEGRTGKLKRLISYLMAPLTIRKLIKKEKPDLLIGYRLTSYGFLAALSGFKPLIIAQQGETDVWPPGHWTEPVKAFMARYAIRRADLVHTWAEHMAEAAYKLGSKKEKTLVLPRGIDLNNFTTTPAKNFSSLTLLVSRALYPEYGHETIFKSVRALKDLNIPVKLYVAGSGSMEQELKQLSADLNLQENILFLGRINNQTLKQYLNECNVYVSMPTTDGVSASLLEAMACYCVPVVSDLPANRIWITHEKNGYLIPVHDHDSLTKSLSHIFNHASESESLTRENRKLVEEKGSQQKNTQVFVSHYQTILNKYN